MKVAIPLFQNRVSPRFDCAPKIMVVTIEKNRVTSKEEFSLASFDTFQRTALLCQQGVNTLICGSIMDFSKGVLVSRGVRVICPVCGDAEQALKLYVEGKLRPERFQHDRRRRRGGSFGRGGRCRRGARG
jgi:predicted Fe-Mo cluster-binding NifX family protein